MKIKKGYAFDDVLLVPKYSNITSRSNVDTSVSVAGLKFEIPIISANMKHVTGPRLAKQIANLGGLSLLHRFQDSEGQYVTDYLESIEQVGYENNVGISVGVYDYLENIESVGEKLKIVCVDVAHGHTQLAINTVEDIAKRYPDLVLIAGNICTVDGFRDLANAGAKIVKAGVGCGCFSKGTRVLMANGFYKNIEDIKPGDEIINKNGDPRRVLKSFSTGFKKVSRVRNSIFYKDTYVTPDHRYFIGDLSTISKDTLKSQGYAYCLNRKSKTIPKSSKLKWQEIGESENIAFLMPRSINFKLKDTFSKNIIIRNGGNGYSSIKNKVDFTMVPNYNLGYIFGTFLGDGHALLANNGKTNIGSVSWYFGLHEENIAQKLSLCIKKTIGRDLKIQKKENIILCTLYHKPFAEFLASFGKRNCKGLPEEYLVNNLDYLNGLRDGLVDSDGSIEANGRVNFSNTSIKLIELFNIVTYLIDGVFPNNQKNKISAGNLEKANIENFNQLYTSRINKTASKRLIENYQISKMLEFSNTSIEVEVFDLTIDCDTHSFIANNAIVHNSLCTTRIQTGNGYPQLSALHDIYNYRLHSSLSNVGIIADGGIKTAGDIVKALVYSDMVMIGSLLAGTKEAPGSFVSINGDMYKEYAGSSTFKDRNIEGVKALVKAKGSVQDVIVGLVDGLRSGMSYQGAKSLSELRNNAEFIEITPAGLAESKPHIIGIK